MPRARSLVAACHASEAGGLRLHGLRVSQGGDVSFMVVRPERTVEDRVELFRTAGATVLEVVGCDHPGCDAYKSVEAALQYNDSIPAVWQTQYQRPGLGRGFGWTDEAPLRPAIPEI